MKDDKLMKESVLKKSFSRPRRSSPPPPRDSSVKSRSPHSPRRDSTSGNRSRAQSKSRTGNGSGRGGPSGGGSGNSRTKGEEGKTGSGGKSNQAQKRGGNGKNKRGKKCKSNSFSSPENFEQAWSSSFFPSSLLLLITSLGFCVKRIPFLNKLPIGGRLSFCSDAWKSMCQSTWVNNVFSEGYRIPFKFVPLQKNVPSNPTATGAAFDVLVAEAEALNLKCAIAPVAPCEG